MPAKRVIITAALAIKALQYQLIAITNKFNQRCHSTALSFDKALLIQDAIQRLMRADKNNPLAVTKILEDLVFANSRLQRGNSYSYGFFGRSKGSTAKLNQPDQLIKLATKFDKSNEKNPSLTTALVNRANSLVRQRCQTLITSMKSTLFVLFEKYASKINPNEGDYTSAGQRHSNRTLAFEQARAILTTLQKLRAVNSLGEARDIFAEFLDRSEAIHDAITYYHHLDSSAIKSPHQKLMEKNGAGGDALRESRLEKYAARYEAISETRFQQAAFNYCKFNALTVKTVVDHLAQGAERPTKIDKHKPAQYYFYLTETNNKIRANDLSYQESGNIELSYPRDRTSFPKAKNYDLLDSIHSRFAPIPKGFGYPELNQATTGATRNTARTPSPTAGTGVGH
jgi:hypothetical protein